MGALVPNTTVFEAVAYGILKADYVADLTPQGVGNLAWAYAKVDIFDPQLLGELCWVILDLPERNAFSQCRFLKRGGEKKWR